MLSLDQLSKQIDACRSGLDIDTFEDWFRRSSWGSYDRPGEPLSDAIASIEVALSRYDSGELNEQGFVEELANAVPQLASSAPNIDIAVSKLPDSAPVAQEEATGAAHPLASRFGDNLWGNSRLKSTSLQLVAESNAKQIEINSCVS
jgi:hypothetical protein